MQFVFPTAMYEMLFSLYLQGPWELPLFNFFQPHEWIEKWYLILTASCVNKDIKQGDFRAPLAHVYDSLIMFLAIPITCVSFVHLH